MKAGYLGALRHVLKLQDFAMMPDGSGGLEQIWQPLDECPEVYAAIHDIGAVRGVEAAMLKTIVRHKIHMLYRADVEIGMRLIGEDKIYTIEAVLDVANRKEYLEIQARSE